MSTAAAPTNRFWSYWVVDLDGTEHAVTDEDMSAAHERGGVYVPLCGIDFTPASMLEPPRTRCRACVLMLQARRSMSDMATRVHTPAPRIRWLPWRRRTGNAS